MLRLRTLGGLSLTSDTGPLSGAAVQRRRLAVLAALAVAGPHGLSRDRLLALLWPERDAAGGRQALSQALYALRRDTGADALVLGVGSEELRLNPAAVTADVIDFEAAVARGDREAAAAHYGGPFLDGVYLTGDDGTFERWADDHRVRLGALAERALEALAGDAQRGGDHAAAAAWWRRLTALDPLRTRAAAGLIQALAATGDRVGALRHADAYARRVREELEAAPSAVVTALADRLRADAARDATTGGTTTGGTTTGGATTAGATTGTTRAGSPAATPSSARSGAAGWRSCCSLTT
jgi:serine/threonine-protein kinase